MRRAFLSLSLGDSVTVEWKAKRRATTLEHLDETGVLVWRSAEVRLGR